jgi:hypothetical protein
VSNHVVESHIMRRLVLLMVGLSPIVVGIVALAQVAAAQQSTSMLPKG